MSLGQLPVTAKRNYIFRTYWTYRIKVFFRKQVCNRVFYRFGACGNRCMLDCGRWKDGIWYGLHPTSAQAGFLSPLQHAIYHLIMWGNMQHTNWWCDVLCFSFCFGFRLWLPWIFVSVCVCVCFCDEGLSCRRRRELGFTAQVTCTWRNAHTSARSRKDEVIHLKVSLFLICQLQLFSHFSVLG